MYEYISDVYVAADLNSPKKSTEIRFF